MSASYYMGKQAHIRDGVEILRYTTLIVPTEEAMALKLVPTWFPNTVLRGALSYFGYRGVIRVL